MARWQTDQRLEKGEEHGRTQDIFEKLEEAQDPKTGSKLSPSDLNSEAIGLIVAGATPFCPSPTSVLEY